jgi:hypothetical protein
MQKGASREAEAWQMNISLSGKKMAHYRPGAVGTKIGDFFQKFGLINGHSHVLPKIFGPSRYQVFQTEQAGAI